MTCEECGEPSDARYCSTRCQKRANVTGLRKCEWCHEPLGRKRFPTRWESPEAFARRRHCDHSCVTSSRAWRDAQEGRNRVGTTQAQLLAMLFDYQGLPLTYDDFVDELGARRDTVRQVITDLVRSGRVERFEFDGQSHFRIEPQAAAA